jgi:two-component system, LytTR family, response regulator
LTPLRALIVDDEQIARQILRDELELLPGVHVAGEAVNGEDALLKYSTLQPNLLFVDIEMPVMNGFDLIRNLPGQSVPAIIMVTAYDQYAMDAFQAGAIDYLLKPFKAERLKAAVERARKIALTPPAAVESLRRLNKVVDARYPGILARPRKIVGKLGEEFFLLNPGEVLAFQAEGNLVRIITLKQQFEATQNLKTIQDRLQNTSFRRIHRNALVNIEQIRKMSMISSQRWLITMSNGLEFIVSKRQAVNVRDVLNW